MRQAIEEGFILDPLRHYLTYNTYWKLVNENPDEKEVDPAKANPLLARYPVTHPSTVAQHAQIIIEHFRAHTAGRLGGRAKAMVVTASRLGAVQMYRALKSYVADQGYPDPGILVAFSGPLAYDGEETSESKENGGLPETALAKAFGYTRADDPATRHGGAGQREYRILVVAEKYQTGSDQPLLTTMYVNKTLTGIAAVQTLSRLNRTAERKSQADLAVLDFVNEAEHIQQAFQPFYEQATTLPSDPNLLFDAQSRLMAPPILVEAEMDSFVTAYLAAEQRAAGSAAVWQQLHAELYRHLAPAVERFTELADSEDELDRQDAERLRGDLDDYVRKYSFLSQIVPYDDPGLGRLYLYGRLLAHRLPRRHDGGVDIGEVDLSHLRVEKTGEHDLQLAAEGPALTGGFADGGAGAGEARKSLLSELIERFNQRHGTEFTEQDVLAPFQEALAEPKVRLAASPTTRRTSATSLRSTSGCCRCSRPPASNPRRRPPGPPGCRTRRTSTAGPTHPGPGRRRHPGRLPPRLPPGQPPLPRRTGRPLSGRARSRRHRLQQFQQVLAHVRDAHGDASPTALDLRRSIGSLLLAEGRVAEAGRTLQPLYDDLALVYGPDHEESREIADILARLRITGTAP